MAYVPLITASFFVAERSVPNVTKAEVVEKLAYFIKKYEQECLLNIFGYPLFKAFVDEQALPVTQRMKDIIEGKDYLNDSENLIHWEGLIHDTNLSLIADYIYFNITRDNTIWVSGMGGSIPNKDTAVIPTIKLLNSWNSFSESASNLVDFLIDNNEDYLEYNSTYASKALCFSGRVNEFDI